MDLAAVTRLLPSLAQLRTEWCCCRAANRCSTPNGPPIAQLLRGAGLKVWLLTSGLALAKHARRAAALFDAITVSLDGTDPTTYAAIRGLDAFDKVCEGIRAAAGHGLPPGIRVTLQRAKFPAIAGIRRSGEGTWARARFPFWRWTSPIPHAFGRTDDFVSDLALRAGGFAGFRGASECDGARHPEDFRSGFIAESPQKLRRILQYFAAVHGQGAYPPVRCNAPEFSAVIGATGRVQPCFFIAGPARCPIRG